MKRREFVIKSSLITTSILAPMSLSSCTSSSSQNRVGIQLYSVRDEMNKNPKETLKNEQQPIQFHPADKHYFNCKIKDPLRIH